MSLWFCVNTVLFQYCDFLSIPCVIYLYNSFDLVAVLLLFFLLVYIDFLGATSLNYQYRSTWLLSSDTLQITVVRCRKAKPGGLAVWEYADHWRWIPYFQGVDYSGMPCLEHDIQGAWPSFSSSLPSLTLWSFLPSLFGDRYWAGGQVALFPHFQLLVKR